MTHTEELTKHYQDLARAVEYAALELQHAIEAEARKAIDARHRPR